MSLDAATTKHYGNILVNAEAGCACLLKSLRYSYDKSLNILTSFAKYEPHQCVQKCVNI